MTDKRIYGLKQTIQTSTKPGVWYKVNQSGGSPPSPEQACLVDLLYRFIDDTNEARNIITNVIHPLIPSEFHGAGRQQAWAFLFSDKSLDAQCDVMYFNDQCETIEPIVDILTRAIARMTAIESLTKNPINEPQELPCHPRPESANA